MYGLIWHACPVGCCWPMHAKLVLLPCGRGQSQESQAYIINKDTGIKDSSLTPGVEFVQVISIPSIPFQLLPGTAAIWQQQAAAAYLQLVWTDRKSVV